MLYLTKRAFNLIVTGKYSSIKKMADYVIISFSVSLRRESWILMDESWIYHGWCHRWLSRDINVVTNDVLKIPWSRMIFHERPYVVILGMMTFNYKGRFLKIKGQLNMVIMWWQGAMMRWRQWCWLIKDLPSANLQRSFLSRVDFSNCKRAKSFCPLACHPQS